MLKTAVSAERVGAEALTTGARGSSANGSNLMNGGGFLLRIEDDLLRPPAPEALGIGLEVGELNVAEEEPELFFLNADMPPE